MTSKTRWLHRSAIVLVGVPLATSLMVGCAQNVSPSPTKNQMVNQVAGQNGSQTVPATTNQASNRIGNQTEKQPSNQTENQAGNQVATGGGNTGSSPKSVTIPKQKTLSYEIEGETDSKTATAYVSSNQPFYMYVLSGYKATPEEPGKDIVDFALNHDAWMRVEVLQPGLSSQQIEQDARNILSSTSKHVQGLPSSDLPADAFFANCSAWYANGSGGSSMVMVAPVNGTPVRFFLHVPSEWESPAQFESMMATLHLVQPGQTVTAS